MNVSETGFVNRLGESEFTLRWFTPSQEVPLCGHVTRAAAHIIWQDMRWTKRKEITFRTQSGSLEARRRAEGIEIALPINRCIDIPPPGWLAQAIDVQPTRILGAHRKYLIELATESEVLQVRPDFALLRKVADRGLILTARSDDRSYDIVSRYFASYVGVDEDPVTGSAHCCLIPYWSLKLCKSMIHARQASARGGELSGYRDGERVRLIGKVRTVLSGQLII